MAHGVRKHIARGIDCPVGKAMCFTQWDTAEAARIRLGAERVYKCSACGYLHVTRDTEADYSQKMAVKGCTSESEGGTMVSSTQSEGEHDEGQAPGRGQQAAGSGDAGEAPKPRRWDPRLTPSPDALARILKGRSDS